MSLSGRARHGLKMSEVGVMLRDQGGGCLYCGTRDFGTTGPVVDHDHALAAVHAHPSTRGCPVCVRGVACRACNLALGYVRDNPVALRRMAEILDAFRVRHPLPAPRPEVR
jgi:hypothetical protein